ncbi:hypothetical protein D3C77_621800 [compost metagenome]
MDIGGKRIVIDVRQRHIPNKRVELCHIGGRNVDRCLVLHFQQEASRRFPPCPYPAHSVNLLLPELLQPMDQVLLGFGAVTSASTLLNSFSSVLFVDLPDAARHLLEAGDCFLGQGDSPFLSPWRSLRGRLLS